MSFFRCGLLLFCVLLSFQNCGVPGNYSNADLNGSTSLGSSSADGASTVGPNFTGNWSLKRLDCYDSAISKVTATAVFSGLAENLVIAGNRMTKNITQGSCVATSSMGVVFQTTSLAISNEIVSLATGGNCVVISNLSGNSILPRTSSITYATSEKVLPAERSSFYFYRVSGGVKELAIIADYSDLQRNYCYKIYQSN